MTYELRHSTSKAVSKCKFYPLGATILDNGVNFALYSQNANDVFLLLFDRTDGEPTDIIRLEERTRYVWHCFEEESELGDYWLFLILNADYREQSIRLPPPKPGMAWYRLIDTSLQDGEDLLETGKEKRLDMLDIYLAQPRSTVMLLAR